MVLILIFNAISVFCILGCQLYNSMDVACMSFSVNILVIMSFERYIMIKRPMERQTIKFYRAILKSAVAFVIAIVISAPMFVISEKIVFQVAAPPEPATNHSEIAEVSDNVTNETVEIVRCVAGISYRSTQKYYEAAIYSAIFFVPGGLITTCYALLVKSFRRNAQYFGTSGSAHNPNNGVTEMRVRQIKRLSRMVLIIIACFMFCFLPFGTLRLIQFVHPVRTPPWLFHMLITMTYLNACMNPILYTFLSNRYQNRLKNLKNRCHVILVRLLPCLAMPPNHHQNRGYQLGHNSHAVARKKLSGTMAHKTAVSQL